MHKRMTITLDEAVYDGLNRTIGKRRMSQFIEDLLRRERLAHPYSQAFFWRTAAGAEIDLLLQRDAAMRAIEIKAGLGTARQARSLGDALDDAGAPAGWIVDQGEGGEALNARVRRRGYSRDFAWLPD